MDDKPVDLRIEEVDSTKGGGAGDNVVGTVQLLDHNEIILVPTPTREPRGSVSSPANDRL